MWIMVWYVHVSIFALSIRTTLVPFLPRKWTVSSPAGTDCGFPVAIVSSKSMLWSKGHGCSSLCK